MTSQCGSSDYWTKKSKVGIKEGKHVHEINFMDWNVEKLFILTCINLIKLIFMEEVVSIDIESFGGLSTYSYQVA